MPDPRKETTHTGAEDPDYHPDENAEIQGLDLAEYTRDGQPLPLLTPFSFSSLSSQKQNASETSTHPSQDVEVIDYFPKSHSVPVPRILRSPPISPFSLPTPPLLPRMMPDVMLPSTSNRSLNMSLETFVHSKSEKAQIELVAEIIQDIELAQKPKRGKKRKWGQISSSSWYDYPQESEGFENEVSPTRSMIHNPSSTNVSDDLIELY